MNPTLVALPPPNALGTVHYAVKPREKRSFHTVLDASKLLDSSRRTRVELAGDDRELVLRMEHPLALGRLLEEVALTRTPDGLVAKSFRREAYDVAGALVRQELVPDFRQDTIALPTALYPEVALPFILGWFPHDGKRRCVYAWINDRFVARMYVEGNGRSTLQTESGPRDAVELVMYPDLNDWVHLGSVLSRLAKPFLPKYRMWVAPAAPHRLLRFEGPYGPPGAPEIILEIASES